MIFYLLAAVYVVGYVVTAALIVRADMRRYGSHNYFAEFAGATFFACLIAIAWPFVAVLYLVWRAARGIA